MRPKMHNIFATLWQGGKPIEINLVRAGVSAIVNLDSNGQDLIDQDECPRICCQVMMPIDDAGFPGLPWLKAAVAIVEALINAGHTVYVHCYEGISRSVMLVAAYAMKKEGWTVDTALEWIAARNERLNPNRSFMVGLKEWQRHLRGEDE